MFKKLAIIIYKELLGRILNVIMNTK